MFYYIDGPVAILEPGIAVIDCGGVGYELNITNNTLSQLRVGERARLYTYSVIKEDCFDLFGFATKEEKKWFELLIGVSGVGPKAAQAILSSATPDSLAFAVLSGNEKTLTAAPGVGKKIAQRVLLELKDKIDKAQTELGASAGFSAAASQDNGSAGKLTDAAAALTVLGYGNNEIAAALRGLQVESMEVQDIIRAALKKMAK